MLVSNRACANSGPVSKEGSLTWQAVTTIKILVSHQRWFETQTSAAEQAYQVLESWLKDDEVQQFLQVNRYQDVLWFNREMFEQLLWWMLLTATVTTHADPLRPADEIAREIATYHDVVETLQQAKEKYQIEGIVTGAVASTYQASRIKKICDELNLECLNPLWQIDQIQLLKELVENKFEVIINGIAAYPLDEKRRHPRRS